LPALKKSKTAPSAGKIMLSAFWDVNHVVHSGLGTTMNSEYYFGTMQKLKAHIQRVCPDMQLLFLQHDKARPHMTK
jgi:hypothetical protein